MNDPAPRLCFAAAHVALHESYRALDHRLDRPAPAAEIAAHLDWDTTMALRRWLDDLGFGIAEAMDTAQRFFLGWDAASALIERTGAMGLRHGFCAGASTDHLPAVTDRDQLVEGVVYQCRFVARHGGIPVILPMPLLCHQRAGEQDYVDTYRRIVEQLDGPVLLHWLGPMFLPELAGYFPGGSLLAVLALDRAKIRGVKLSMLDSALEVWMRRVLLRYDQLVLTGDDFHFGRLILGGDTLGPPPAAAPPVLRHTTVGRHRVALGDFSHALLGVFDAIAAPASMALRALAAGDTAGYLRRMLPCEELGRHVFAAPTQHYKAGLAFLSWLAGRQPNAMLVRREDLARGRAHQLRAAELAFACGALPRTAIVKARLAAFEGIDDDRR
ncbi:MAG: DUF993 family protein [Planctomycetota bacterium]